MRKYCSPVIVENFFEPCILFLMLEKSGYGYELERKLREECGCRVNIGNLYRGLNRLVKQRYIAKKTGVSKIGQKRITYRITNEGKKYLASWIEDLKNQNKIITKLINNYEANK